MKTLSPKQEQILQYIYDFIEENNYPPSVRDIQSGCTISSTSVVDYNMRALETHGYINRNKAVARGLELLWKNEETQQKQDQIREIPLLGQIAAGAPIDVPNSESSWVQQAEEIIPVSSHMLGKNKDIFALRVKGTSMIDDLIDDGDIILLKPAKSAEKGQKVAVWLKDEAATTLKRYYPEGNQIRLQPANKTMDPIITKSENVEIQAIFIGSIRPADG
jgi:repressor LexA